MWPPSLGDSSFQIPLLPPPPPPQLLPPHPLSMLLRCLAPPGIDFPLPNEVAPRLPTSPFNQLEPNIDYAFPFLLQPIKIFPKQNDSEVKRSKLEK